ncbi:MAG: nucleoside monophosphate kinase [Candidatus Cloacimonetes bacterium]|jgi:adenylate kinase|nr:nucleoside monophosphate kinase [Candidatus Cloacimonadota bacterium]HQB50571.1 nucleoside monophosphate kinase [Candidatus Cloacimonas sp.]
MQCFVFLGIQGSGKGTQAELLSERINFQHINIGDLLREQVMKRTELGLKVQDIIGRGDLVPDALVFEIVESSLNPDRKGIVFDGFPRTLVQAKYLVEHFEVLQVFFLELAEDEAIARLSSRRVCPACGANYNILTNKPNKDNFCDVCGTELIIRQDDQPEVISRRVKEFYEQTLALKEFFAKRGILSVIDASEHIEEIAAKIADIAERLLKNK